MIKLRWIRWGCIGVTIALFGGLGFLISGLWSDWKAAEIRTAQEHENVNATAAQALDQILDDMRRVAAEAAEALSHIEEPSRSVVPLITEILARSPEVISIGVAFAPFDYDRVHRLAAPEVLRQMTGDIIHQRIEAEYDYTASTVHWYQQALKEGTCWEKPHLNERNTVINFAQRVTLKSGQVAVVRVSSSLQRVIEIVTHLDLGPHGYGVLKDGAGTYIVPPALTREGQDENLSDVGNVTLTRVIEGPNWVFQTFRSWRDHDLDYTDRHQRILWVIYLLVSIPIFIAAAHLTERRETHLAWVWSSAIAVCLMVGIVVIWSLALNGVSHMRGGMGRETNTVVASRGALDGFKLKVLSHSLEKGEDLPLFVKTGVFIQSVEFLTANNLQVTGYVWQRVPKESLIAPGIIFPEAEEVELEETIRRDQGRETVIVWRLKAVMRQSFSYVKFPFDRESVWLRMWSADFEKPVVLVPDFNAYSVTNPIALPGLERTLFISGWSAIRSYFEYRHNSYNSTLGAATSFTSSGRPELYFNVDIVRNFLDPFVSQITPILLVLLLIFAMQMTVTRRAEQKDLLGFNAATIITTCAALFFAVLISHIETRSALAAKRIFYGEYFYLVTYAVILAACINAILFTHDKSLPWVQFKDNLLSRILYWPIVMAAMFGITFVTFY